MEPFGVKPGCVLAADPIGRLERFIRLNYVGQDASRDTVVERLREGLEAITRKDSEFSVHRC